MFGRFLRASVIVLVCLSVFEAISWPQSPTFGPCLVQPEQQAASGQNNQQQACPSLFEGSLILLGWADHFIESHDKSIVATFTVVLAISTIGLWVATARLWRATNDTLDH